MHPLDVKKIIIAFLVLAVGASATGVFLSSYTPPAATRSSSANPADPTLVATGAFVEHIPTIPADGYMPETAVPAPLTATEGFADALTSKIVDNNPDGPLLIGSPTGPGLLNLPSQDYLSGLFADAIVKNSTVLNKSVSLSELIVRPANADTLQAYGDAVQRVADTYFTPRLQALLSENSDPTPETLNAAWVNLDGAATALRKIPVPDTMKEFHRALVQFITHEKDTLAFAAVYDTDPVKSLAAVSTADDRFAADTAVLDHAIAKLSMRDHAGALSLSHASFITYFFGIPRAEAFAAIVHDPINFGQLLKSFLFDLKKDLKDHLFRKILASTIKLIINRMQAQVINWANGGGKPQFVTNWKQFLQKAGNDAAGIAISKIAPQLCSSFGPLVRITLKAVTTPPEPVVSCTLSRVKNNLSQFYNDFRSGGWISYSEAVQPTGNYWGSLIISSDIVAQQQADAQASAKNEAASGGGFFGIKKCVQSHIEDIPDLSGTGGVTGQTVKICDKTAIQTPGQVIGGAVTQSISWKPNEIVNAKDIGDLISALVDASLNKLVKKGLAAIASAGSDSNGGTVPASGPGVSDENGNPIPGTEGIGALDTQTALDTITQDIATASSTIDTDNQWFVLQPSVISLLDQVSSACPSFAGDVSSTISQLASSTEVLDEQTGARNDTLTLQSFQSQLATTTDNTVVQTIETALDPLTTHVTNANSSSTDRYNALLNLQSNAQANLPNNCNISLK